MINIKLMKEHTKNLNVLYVEDDIVLTQTTSSLIGNFFTKIDIAYDGEDGLVKYREYEKEHGKTYDVIITDINMPKMNGIEMSEKILEINSEQIIVITSAHNDIECLSRAIDLGIDGFITKPIQNEKLIKVLYKVAHTISNNKFVESHIDIIEDLNMQLEIQNKDLIRKNKELEKSFRMLDTMVNKEQISHPSKASQKIDEENQIDTHLQEQIEHLIYDDLGELKEIHIEIDLIIINILNSSDSINISYMKDLTNKFSKYASILSFYNFFDELSASMENFATAIKENQIPKNKENIKNTFMLLESFIYVLGKWQNNLSDGDSRNINSLDSSMISDMETIVNMWTKVDEELPIEELDDIFDF